MKDGRLGFGLIGCGVAAEFHYKAINSCSGAFFAGAYDMSEERSRSFCDSHKIRQFESWSELLESPDIDAVCICTPSWLHAQQAVETLKSGRHVLIEKPAAIRSSDCIEIIKAAKENNRVAAVVSQLRYSYGIALAKKAIDEGRLGKLILARQDMFYYRSEEYYLSSKWRGKYATEGGGALMNQGIHGIDLLLYLLGRVSSVRGDVRTLARNIEVEDTAAAELEFENGALGVITATTCVYPGEPKKLGIYGTKGSIELTEDSITKWCVEGDDPSDYICAQTGYQSYSSPEAVPDSSHGEVIKDFCEAIMTGRRPVSGVEDGMNAVSLIEAIYDSSKRRATAIPGYIPPNL